MQKNKKGFFGEFNIGRPKTLAVCAFLIALGIILSKYLSFTQVGIRIGLGELPVLIAGLFCGPVAGALVGVIADLVGCVLVGYAINPIITFGVAATGFIAGVLYNYAFRHLGFTLRIMLSVYLSSIVGSLLITTYGVYIYYYADSSFFAVLIPRLLTFAVNYTACFLFIRLLVLNKGVAGYLGNMRVTGEKAAMSQNTAAYIRSLEMFGSKPGLERITALMDKLGNPQDGLKFIHIAGTNGKGSVCAMLNSIFMAQGYRTGLYTSPYIEVFNERMRVNSVPIGAYELDSITDIVREKADELQEEITEFEFITAVAMVYFRRAECDYVILETGLGGRLDATNIIKDPLLSVITGIALDHTSVLGSTIEEIAFEKAGIIKKNCPVLYGGNDKNAETVIKRKCIETDSTLSITDNSAVQVRSATLKGTEFTYKNRICRINLLGLYQPYNAACVLDAVDILRNRGVRFDEKSVLLGIEKTTWKARFELLSENPVIIFDGGHNPQGVTAAVESVKHYFGGKKIRIVSGVLADKDYLKIVELLKDIASEAYTVTPPNPRALAAEKYAAVFTENDVPAKPFSSVAEGVRAACGDGMPVLIAGSLYMYGEVKKSLDNRR